MLLIPLLAYELLAGSVCMIAVQRIILNVLR